MKKWMISFFFLSLVIFAGAQTISRWKVEDLMDYASKSDSALIINFWATYCGPCIEELPYFHTISETYKNKKVKLLLVSLDFADYYPAKIQAFAKKRKYTAQIVWLDEEKPDYFCPKVDEAWSGAMPATLFFNPKTGYRNFIEAQIKPEQLDEEIQKMLQEKSR
jgi:thiol-disulfide isomerase/thioredoxin